MTDTSVVSNVAALKARIFEDVKDIGRTEGAGKVARIKLIEFVVAESKNGPLSVDDSGDLWKSMMQGAAEAQQDVGGQDPKDTAQRTSDLKHFIVLGNNKNLDGPELVDNAKQRMRALRSSGAVKNARLWEMMLTWARAQNKSPERALTDQEIDKLFEDKERKARELNDKLWTHRQGLLKANEGVDAPEIYKVCEDIEKFVQASGGTTKQKKLAKIAAKKAAEEAAEKKAKANANKKGKGASATV